MQVPTSFNFAAVKEEIDAAMRAHEEQQGNDGTKRRRMLRARRSWSADLRMLAPGRRPYLQGKGRRRQLAESAWRGGSRCSSVLVRRTAGGLPDLKARHDRW